MARSDSRDVRHSVETLHLDLMEFRKLEPQRDDITIVGLSVK